MRFLKLFKYLFKGRKSGYSLKGFWGETKHFNKDGVQIGYSVKGFWGGRKRYDMDGNLISYTLKSFWGGYDTYDAEGNLIRRSRRNVLGGYNTYDKNANKKYESYRNFWEGMTHIDVEEESDYNEKAVEVKEHKSTKPKKVAKADEVKSHDEKILNQFVDHISNGKSPKDYVKILVFEYQDLKEFPALVYKENDEIIVEPQIVDAVAFKIPYEQIRNAKLVTIEGLGMDAADNEFIACVTSKIGSEFEDLLPEYYVESDGISRTQYEFECGLVITERSMQVITSIK